MRMATADISKITQCVYMCVCVCVYESNWITQGNREKFRWQLTKWWLHLALYATVDELAKWKYALQTDIERKRERERERERGGKVLPTENRWTITRSCTCSSGKNGWSIWLKSKEVQKYIPNIEDQRWTKNTSSSLLGTIILSFHSFKMCTPAK